MSSRQRRPHALAVSPGHLLLLALTMLGLFAMHGLQATASPVEMRPATVAVVMPGMGHTSAETGHDMSVPPSHDAPGHKHPGGQICLALLVVAALLILYAVFVGRSRRPVATVSPAGLGSGSRGRAPPGPSVFQLSVLRL
ncbi:DUF6153 family protein [Actinoallomurus purpureus]|uniref:DUF6153 family protein n=1 Tax=Actinoallomurus purpureus TaxID=478114 RepID=UPI002093416C|nr:DUF6153 family protein [Actinoallomurus purpureus]MCO6006142.1 DUF6153 family protein [Actinoallomurus purpureus]